MPKRREKTASEYTESEVNRLGIPSACLTWWATNRQPSLGNAYLSRRLAPDGEWLYQKNVIDWILGLPTVPRMDRRGGAEAPEPRSHS